MNIESEVKPLGEQVSDDEDDDLYEDSVDIGLLNKEPDENEDLVRLFLRCPTLYPCKIGGKPQWLHLNNLPTNLTCSTCQTVLTFLLQIYAPLNSNEHVDDPRGFHRYLYVFICAQVKCSNQSRTIKVYRSEMNRKNDYYAYDAPPPKRPDNRNEVLGYVHSFYKSLFERDCLKFCNICGMPCSKKCSKCNLIYYCSEYHQRLDWTKNNHKTTCNSYIKANSLDDKTDLYIQKELLEKDPNLNEVTFPEYEILIEPEERDDKDDLEFDQQKVADELKLNENLSKDLEGLPENDHDDDFLKFQKRIKRNHNQILRYDRGGQPLWATRNGKLAKNVPNCETCNSKRVFEFQIMPQLLNHLKLNEDVNVETTLDWASLYVYTCAKSCAKQAYIEEFIFKQDFL